MEIDTVMTRGHDSAEPEFAPSCINFSRRSLLAGEDSVSAAPTVRVQASSCPGSDAGAGGRDPAVEKIANRSSLPQQYAVTGVDSAVGAVSDRDATPGRLANRCSLPQRSGPASGKGALGFRLLAVSAAGAGGLGVLLPLVPTTPFLLLALWAASKGSPELHARIRHHPRFRPTLEAWQRDRAVPLKAKLLAVVMMLASWLTLWATGAAGAVLIAVGLFLLGVASFLLSRPTSRSHD